MSDPAFPGQGNFGVFNQGMTYRQWLVGMALQGVISQVEVGPKTKDDELQRIVAVLTVGMADAVLAEESKIKLPVSKRSSVKRDKLGGVQGRMEAPQCKICGERHYG